MRGAILSCPRPLAPVRHAAAAGALERGQGGPAGAREAGPEAASGGNATNVVMLLDETQSKVGWISSLCTTPKDPDASSESLTTVHTPRKSFRSIRSTSNSELAPSIRSMLMSCDGH